MFTKCYDFPYLNNVHKLNFLSIMYGIDLFSLHVLNPLFRTREGTQGNYLFHISFDARATTSICMKLCEDKR